MGSTHLHARNNLFFLQILTTSLIKPTNDGPEEKPCHEPGCYHTIKTMVCKQEELWNKVSLNSATYLYCYNSNWVSIAAVTIEKPSLHFEIYHILIIFFTAWSVALYIFVSCKVFVDRLTIILYANAHDIGVYCAVSCEIAAKSI